MSDDEVPTGSGPTGARRNETDWERRKRLAAVFGDGLPDVTSDEKEPGERADDAESASDRWLKSQVPPHHG